MPDSRRPPDAADLGDKLAKFGTLPKRQAVVVKWWQEQSDPALASLGGGVMTITPGYVCALNEDALTIYQHPGVEAARISLPRRLLVDLRFPQAGELETGQPITDDELRKMTGD